MVMELCALHEMSARICGCASVQEAARVLREEQRDFTGLPLGKRTRSVPGIVEDCPLCRRLGVHVVVCARRGRRHEIWVHTAVLSYSNSVLVGHTSEDTCHQYGTPTAPKRPKRRAPQASRSPRVRRA